MFFSQRIEPQAGQESVWDYPRPPRVELSTQTVQIIFNDVVIATTQRSQRLLETSHPPVYYIPPEDIQTQYLHPSQRQSYCEWKGQAHYYTLIVGDRQAEDAAWFYPEPTDAYGVIQNYVAFYPSRMDLCSVDGEIVQAQPGDFYGGWITSAIVGPFKGGVGTWGW